MPQRQRQAAECAHIDAGAAWLDTADLVSQKRISEQMQMLLWQDVPYIHVGHWVPLTAHLPRGSYGMRRV